MKQLTGSFFLLILFSNCYTVKAQQRHLPVATATEINTGLTRSQYEFSALANWKDKVILVPQNKRTIIDSVFMIDKLEIANALEKSLPTAHTTFTINNLKHTGLKTDSLYINNILLDNYDGIEAAVVKSDTVFFSLETDTSFCYVIKGIIDTVTASITILPDTLHVPNTYNINNAGYESLAFFPGKDSLIAFFECNKDTTNARAFMMDASLHSGLKPLRWNMPLYFRLTDVYALNDSQLIGINHLFVSKSSFAERDDYIKDVDLDSVKNQLTNGGDIDTCYTQLVVLLLKDNNIIWRPFAFVSLDCATNYEGIVPFDEGVLIVVDGEPGNNSCKLVYLNLKNL